MVTGEVPGRPLDALLADGYPDPRGLGERGARDAVLRDVAGDALVVVDAIQAVGAVPVPPTHYELDLFGQTDITRIQVDAARYACTLCHAPQAEVTLPVNTTFEPEFRNPDGTFASDLMERWEEGTEVK